MAWRATWRRPGWERCLSWRATSWPGSRRRWRVSGHRRTWAARGRDDREEPGDGAGPPDPREPCAPARRGAESLDRHAGRRGAGRDPAGPPGRPGGRDPPRAEGLGKALGHFERAAAPAVRAPRGFPAGGAAAVRQAAAHRRPDQRSALDTRLPALLPRVREAAP